jgi:hypothetical protein
VRPERLGKFKNSPHRESKPRPSGSDSDRMSYIILRDRWCDFVVMNVYTQTEDKIDDVKEI